MCAFLPGPPGYPRPLATRDPSLPGAYALEGSVVGLGSGDVRLSANVYSLSTAEKVAQGSVQGPTDEVLRLVDELAVAVMRDLLAPPGGPGPATWPPRP